MKLRNKKTGEIGQIGYVATQDGQIIVEDISGQEYPFSVISNYKTLTKLNEDWEDYKPAEPLIKDKKIRKAVRAWAKMNKLERVAVNPPTEDCSIISFTYGMLEIGFFLGRSDISGGAYTIAELCGEEEE